MSPSIAAKAERGAHELVDTAERMLQEMGVKPGPNTLFSVTNSVYYLPIVLGYSAKPVETIRELNEVLKQARALVPTDPALAALLTSETIETLCAIRWALAQPGDEASGPLGITNPISDAQVRSWGVQLADGRMPGIALIMGSASNNAVNAILIEELRQHHILCLLSGHGLPDQLQEEGVGLGDRAYIIPLGSEPSSAAHALGFAARCAMKLGGHKPGAWDEILQYGKRRTPGFVLALGELDDRSWAVALAAQSFGFSLITDGRVPGTDTSHSRLFEPIAGEDDRQTAMRLAEECISARGMKLRQYKVSLPVDYSPAFEDDVIGSADLHIQFGGKSVSAFELLQIAAPDALPDGKVDVVGPELAELAGPGPVEFGLVVMAAGKKLEADFEAYLERQMHTFLNYASGIQHSGGKDAISIRISKAAAAHGLTFQSLGRLLHTRFHEEFPDAIEKLQVLIITEARTQAEWRAKAQGVHQLRLERGSLLGVVRFVDRPRRRLDLLDALVGSFPEAAEDEDTSIKIAIVGKPNSGKSSLLNKLAGKTYDETKLPNPQKSPLFKARSRTVTTIERELYSTIYPLQVGHRKCGRVGLEVCDWLPHLGECIDDVALIRSMYTTDDNHGAQTQFHTGRHMLDGEFPTLGRKGTGTNTSRPRYSVFSL